MKDFKWKDLVGDYIELRNSYDFTVMENKNLWEQIAQHTRTIADYEKRLQEQENETIAVRDQRDAVKRELAQLKLNIDENTLNKMKDLEDRVEILKTDLDNCATDLNESENYVDELKHKLSAAEDTILSLRHDVIEKDEKIAELQNTVVSLKLNIKATEECENLTLIKKDELIANREYELDNLRKHAKGLEDALKSYENQESDRIKEVAEYQAEIRELKDKIEFLKIQSSIYGDDDDDLPWF